MTTVLAVSPHLDDAVFSAGALLWRLARRGVKVVVATVFTGNVERPQGFALACQLDKGLGPEVDYMALRRDEDHAACAILGVEARHLPLLEAPHRGYDDAPALFAGVREDDFAAVEVRTALAALLAELAPAVVLGPRGIGHHADHLIVRDALAALAPPRLLWWEDWPYAVRDGGGRDRAGAHRLPVGAEAGAAKLQACAAYGSQLGFQFGGRARLATMLERQASEYFWRFATNDQARAMV